MHKTAQNSRFNSVSPKNSARIHTKNKIIVVEFQIRHYTMENYTEIIDYTEQLNDTTLLPSIASDTDEEKLSHLSIVMITVFGTIAIVSLIGMIRSWWLNERLDRARRIATEQERRAQAPLAIRLRALAQAGAAPPAQAPVALAPVAQAPVVQAPRAEEPPAELVVFPPPQRVVQPPVRVEHVRTQYPPHQDGRPHEAWGTPTVRGRRVPAPVARVEDPRVPHRRNGGRGRGEATSRV